MATCQKLFETDSVGNDEGEKVPKNPEWKLKETSLVLAKVPKFKAPAPTIRSIKYKMSKVKKQEAVGG